MMTGNPILDQIFAGMMAQQTLLQQQVAALQQSVIPGSPGSKANPTEVMIPQQFRAGVIKYPGKDPFPYLYTVEMEVDEQGTAWGETLAEATGQISVDRSAETFITRFSAYQYQYEHAEQDPPPYALGYLRPLSSVRSCKPVGDDCESLMDFLWQVTYGDEDVAMQKNWLPSSLMDGDHQHGYKLPTEKEITQYETFQISARPLRAAGQGNKWKLFFVVHCYKMLPRVNV